MIIFDADDFGADHIISDMCQSHDCRDVLNAFHDANPAFKATLFAIPYEMTPELLDWAVANSEWIELAQHGITHSSNYECQKMEWEEIVDWSFKAPYMNKAFVKGFKAPGWQISDQIYQGLLDNGWWVADQAYNDERRPKDLPVYKIGDNSMHHHTWNCVGNGVYEQFDYIMDRIKDETEFKFVSEMV